MTSPIHLFPTRDVCQLPAGVASPAGAAYPPPCPPRAAPAGSPHRDLPEEGAIPWRVLSGHIGGQPAHALLDAGGRTMAYAKSAEIGEEICQARNTYWGRNR